MRPHAIAYVALSLADTALSRRDEGSKLRLLTKPLLMPMLVTGIRHEHEDEHCDDPAVHWLRAGLALSGVGDVALMRDSQRAFLIGAGSFLSAHLCYDRAFAAAGSLPVLRRSPRAVTAASVAATGMIAALARIAPGMRAPVVAYGATIGSMAILGFGTRRPLVKAGALLFLVSDMALAIDRFKGDAVNVPKGLVMATYTAAQGLITLGLLSPAPASEAGAEENAEEDTRAAG